MTENQIPQIDDMVSTSSGLMYYDFKQSDGAPTVKGQKISIHYMVAVSFDALENGPWLENSWLVNKPINFKLGSGKLLAGIEEGIEGMKIASQRRMIIPPTLAFGERGSSTKVKPHQTLFVEIYVISAENVD